MAVAMSPIHEQMLARARAQEAHARPMAEKVVRQYLDGLITLVECYAELVEIDLEASNATRDIMRPIRD